MAEASTDFNSKNTLEVKQLTVIRSDVAVFQPVNFKLTAGQSLQIRGANGAGKTTLLRALCGLSNHSEGEIFWNGKATSREPEPFFHDCLFLGHALGLKPKLTAEQNLKFYRNLRFQADPKRIRFALEQLGIGAYFDEYVARMSAGQKRRVALSRIITEPVALWVLDEPMAALDVDGQAWLEQACNQHLQAGGILIVTSHQPIAGIEGLEELHLS